jgi:hypothetical protein
VDEPVTMTEVFVGEAEFFRAKQESDIVRVHAARLKPLSDEPAAFLQRLQRVAQIAMADSCGPHHQGAVRHCFRYRRVLLSLGQQFSSAYRGPCLLKRHLKRIYHPQSAESEVAQGACGRSNIQRIACVHQDDAKTIWLEGGRQEPDFTTWENWEVKDVERPDDTVSAVSYLAKRSRVMAEYQG